MEEELLQTMINDRDLQIHTIQRKIEDHVQKQTKLQTQLEEMRQTHHSNELERERHTMLQNYKRSYQNLSDILNTMKQQQNQQNLHLYMDILGQGVETNANNSTYVLRMQSQLCKAMHSMGIIENQLSYETKHSTSIQKFCKDSIISLTEEKSQIELQLLNDLMKEDTMRQEIETKQKEMMTKYWNERDALEQKLEDNSERDDDEDDEEEREELMEILQQGNDEIVRMKNEIQLQKDKLKDYQERLGDDKFPVSIWNEIEELENAPLRKPDDDDDDDETGSGDDGSGSSDDED